MTVFDKYIFGRFVHTVAVLLLAAFGLFVVFDLFTNVDAFQLEQGGAGTMAARIFRYYAFQAADFFEMTGSMLVVVGSMIVLAMLQRRSEIHPILAAGVPTYRIAVPLIVGAVLMNGLLIANQERCPSLW